MGPNLIRRHPRPNRDLALPEGRGLNIVHTLFWLGGHLWALSTSLWANFSAPIPPFAATEGHEPRRKSTRIFPLVMSSHNATA